MSDAFLSALIGAVAGIVTAYFTLRGTQQRNQMEKPKIQSEADLTSAEASSKLSDTAVALLQPYRDEVHRMREEILSLRERMGQMECRISDLEEELRRNERQYDEVVSGAHVLYQQLVINNLKPEYIPPERRTEPRDKELNP